MAETAGRLLLASPAMDDTFFARTVIAMIEHNDQGALGLVLNHPTNILLPDAWEQVEDVPCDRAERLRRGGPVEGPLMVLHGSEALSDRRVASGLFLTTGQEPVRTLVREAHVPAVFFVGYAGWGGGQLERELARTSWVVGPDIGTWILDEDAGPDERLWRRCMRAVDVSLGRLAENPDIVPEDPSQN